MPQESRQGLAEGFYVTHLPTGNKIESDAFGQYVVKDKSRKKIGGPFETAEEAAKVAGGTESTQPVGQAKVKKPVAASQGSPGAVSAAKAETAWQERKYGAEDVKAMGLEEERNGQRREMEEEKSRAAGANLDFGSPETPDEPPVRDNTESRQGHSFSTGYEYSSPKASEPRLEEVGKHQLELLGRMYAGRQIGIPALREVMHGVPRREFDDALRKLRRERRLRMIAIGDLSESSRRLLDEGVPGESETFMYLEPALRPTSQATPAASEYARSPLALQYERLAQRAEQDGDRASAIAYRRLADGAR